MLSSEPDHTADELDSRTKRFCGEVYRWRWALAVLVLVTAVLAMGLGMRWVMSVSGGVAELRGDSPVSAPPQLFDPRVEIWFESDSESVRAYRRIHDELLTDDIVFIAFEEPDDPHGVFGADSLATIHRLTNALTAIPNVRDVRSLTNSLTVDWDAAQGTLKVERLFDRGLRNYADAERVERIVRVMGGPRARALVGNEAVEQILAAIPKLEQLQQPPEEFDGLVSDDGRTTAVLVHVLRPRVPEHVLDTAFGSDEDARALGVAVHGGNAQAEVVRAIEKVLAEETERELHVAGLPILQTRFQSAGEADMVWVGVMFMVIALVLLTIFRSVAGVVLPMLVAGGALIGMQGTVWLFGDLLNNLTVICPNVVTAVAIANSIHLVTSYYALRPHYRDRRTLVVEVLQRNALPVFLTASTTTVGFLSLLSSDIVPMRMLGYTAAVGTMFGYLLAMTLIPAILSLIPIEATTPTPRVADFDRLVTFVQRRRRLILAFTVVATAGAIFGMMRLELATDVRDLLADDDTVRKDMVWIGEHFGGTGDLELLFESPDRIARSREFLDLVADFQRRLEQEARDDSSPLHVVTHFYSPATMMRDVVDVQDAEVPPPFSPGMARFAFVVSKFAPTDMRAFRIAARVDNAPTPQLLAAFDRIREIANTEFPALAGSPAAVASGETLSSMTLTGKFYLFTTMMDRFSRALVLSLSIALATITLLILIVFRSVALAVVSLASNVLPIALPLGFYGLMGMPLDGPAIIVAAIALGVCVDDTIHLLTAFSRARRAGRDTSTALREAFHDVGAALTSTTVVLVLGFSALMFSDFRPNAVIGRLGLVMLSLGWVADFLITPAALSCFDGSRRES